MRNIEYFGEYDSYFFKMKIGKIEKMKIVKPHCHLPLVYHVKMNEKYELLSIYILTM